MSPALSSTSINSSREEPMQDQLYKIKSVLSQNEDIKKKRGQFS